MLEVPLGVIMSYTVLRALWGTGGTCLGSDSRTRCDSESELILKKAVCVSAGQAKMLVCTVDTDSALTPPFHWKICIDGSPVTLWVCGVELQLLEQRMHSVPCHRISLKNDLPVWLQVTVQATLPHRGFTCRGFDSSLLEVLKSLRYAHILALGGRKFCGFFHIVGWGGGSEPLTPTMFRHVPSQVEPLWAMLQNRSACVTCCYGQASARAAPEACST
ncbi:hypothetical protein JZ751_001976 [Albula glossodonta]|uniref:Uncharacterized protein n=1 Tax=Albula glossodonta TaxID=121402 RepID=A0A8T2PAJ8_9TELE|nr:hypothetical protein JZ751_001976 [Albula glossodonta]